jgi:hypothetical protein
MRNQTILDIIDERQLQDAEWGGNDHDDKHDFFDWRQFIYKQLTAASMEAGQFDRQRKRLVKIAALAVAAIESMDRKGGPLT